MSDYDKPLKRVNGQVVPQVWDNTIQDWTILQGVGGAYRVQNAIDVSEDYFEGSGSITKEFASEMIGLIISNDSEPGTSGAASLTFTIHGVTRTVKAGEVYENRFKPFTEVTINSTVPWRAEVIQSYYGASLEVPPPVDTTAPDNVTNLTTSNVTATSLLLSWSPSASSDCVGYDIYRGTSLIASVTGTTYNVTGLSQSTQYTFTVKAKDAANNISSGTSTTITTAASQDTDPPANVTGLTASNVTQTGLTLTWTASVSSDVASYDIFNGTTFLANVTSTTYNVNGLVASMSYTFVVKAKDTSGNSASGTSVNVTTAASLPATPTGLTATPGNAQVALTWAIISGATSYKVYRGGVLIASPTSASYTDTGLTNGTSYSYAVSAVNSSGESSQSAVQSATPIDNTTPNPVTGLTAGTPTTNSIPVTWTKSSSSNVANYEVAFSGNGGTSYTIASAVVNASSTSYEVTGLSPGRSYIIRVVAINGAGNRSTAATVTANTASVPDTTPPEAVTNLTAGTPTSNSVPISFTASIASDISKYEVAYSTDGTNFTVATSTLTGTSYTVTGLNASTLYTFRVVAIDTSGNRSTGNPTVQATTSAPAAGGKVDDASLIIFQTNPAYTQTIVDPSVWFGNGSWTVALTGKFVKNGTLFRREKDTVSGNYTVSILTTFDYKFNSTLHGTVISGGGDAWFTTSPSNTFDFSVDHHFVMRKDASTIKMYIDNTLISTTNIPGTQQVDTLNATKPMTIGGADSADGNNKPVWRSLAFYNRALSDAELLQNYNALK